jgi:hypothetical protein
MAQLKRSLLNRTRVSLLSFGIHDNVAISNIDFKDRKRQGQPEKKMVYLTLATVDPETRKKKSEVELSWFKFDFTSDYLFSNIREFCVQLHGLLSCYMDEEAAFDAMADTFEEFGFGEDFSKLENHKWKKKEIDSLISKLKDLFKTAITPYIGLDKPLIRVKITTDTKGEYSNIPKFGIFTEPMTVDKTNLQFSNYELKNHSKAGNTEVTANNVLKTLD